MGVYMQRRAALALSFIQTLIVLLLLPALVDSAQAQESGISLILNEFMASNAGTIQDEFGNSDDWIEIHNPGSEAIDLGGMYLTDELNDATKWHIDASDPGLTTIFPGGYLLIWVDNEPNQGPLHAPFKLSAGGEQIGLYDQQGRLLDAVQFGPQLQDVAMAREDERWRLTEQPTPGRRNTIGTGEPVLITEIMYNPSIGGQVPENLAEEFIEIHNQGTEAVDLSAWTLVRGIDFVFPEQTRLEAGAYLVVAADAMAFEQTYPGIDQVLGPWSGRLSNSGETIELVDAHGRSVDKLHYADQGDWAQRTLGPRDRGHRGWTWRPAHDGQGRSLELIALNRPNQYGQNWDASQVEGGTPGRANSISQTILAPMIVDVTHDPPMPSSQDEVLVSADIIGTTSSNLSVTLYYRRDTSSYGDEEEYPVYDPDAFTRIPMHDDGTNGDDNALDHQYSALIPAHPHNTVLEFFVEVCDAAGLCRTWPAPGMIDGVPEQVVNALYLVQDSVPNALGASRLPTYHVIMTNMERRRLADIGDSEGGEHNSDAKMNACFISVEQSQTRVRYCSGVRNRGHGSRRRQPNNMRIDFPHDNTWKSVRSINLNTQYTYTQVAGSALGRLAGLPCAEATPVQVRINGANLAQSGGQMYGAYVHVEVIDSDFVQRYFPQDDGGNLYKCMRSNGPEADLTYRGEQAGPYRPSYLKRTNKALDDFTDIIDLCYAADASPAETYVDEIQDVAQVDQWLRYLAINVLFNNTETSLGNGVGDDYYCYRGVADPRFVLIPHDFDSILRGNTREGIFRPMNRRTIARLLNTPAYAARYYHQLQDLIHTTLAPDHIDMVLTHLLGDYVPAGLIQNMVNFQAERNDYVLSLIQGDLSIESNFTQSGGNYVADTNSVVLWGTADPIPTQSVMVNGLLAQWSPLNGQWTLSDPARNRGETLISSGSVWTYYDHYTDLGPEWYLNLNTTDWPEGPAELGYGDEATNNRPEITTIGFIDADPDTPGLQRNPTTYFSHAFTVTNPSLFGHLSLRLVRDDGAVVYLNGTEIARSNMPAGPVDYHTRAIRGVSGEAEAFFYGGQTSAADEDFTHIDSSLLVPGLNRIAVEIHQIGTSSSDISFDLTLVGIPRDRALLTLQPGINRMVVQSFDGPDGSGHELARAEVDIWYKVQDPQGVGGRLNQNTVLDAASGPWLVAETLTVPSGVTLTIEPGTTIFFQPGTGISVTAGGRLIAEGTAQQHIRLTRPTPLLGWNGILLDHSLEDNRLCYVDCEFGNDPGPAITVEAAQVLLDHVTWPATDALILELHHPRAVIRECIFPSLSDTEPVHGSGLSGDEYLIFEACVFGTSTGYNDIIDFSGGHRPGPILQIYDSVFLGGGDDGVDLDGADAHIEGNTFMNFTTDPGSSGTSNAVATGRDGADAASVYLARNVFAYNDYAVLVKEAGELIAQNNSFVNNTVAAISFGEPFRSSPRPPGQGALLEGNILWNNTAAFAHYFQNPPNYGPEYLSVHHSILPTEWLEMGQANLDADPLFVDAYRDFRLRPGSNAIGTGPGGTSMGATADSGAFISGEPRERTHTSSATLTIGGPGIVSYRYSLNDPTGPFSMETSVHEPLELSGLLESQTYVVYVQGKNSAGRWQDTPTASRAWTIDSSTTRLLINEILVVNTLEEVAGTLPALLELYYEGPTALDLSGYSLSTDANSPGQYRIPSGTLIQPNGYHRLAVHTVNTWHVDSPLPEGMVLDPNGGELRLFDSADQPIDVVSFGHQLADLSMGRFGDAQGWRLCLPTLGASNQLQPTGDSTQVRINEWLANSEAPLASDFIELFNPNAWPVDIGNYYVTDAPIGRPDKFRLPPASFIKARGFLVLLPDGQSRPGHLDFKLSANGEMLALLDQDLVEVDELVFKAQLPNVSTGRAPDGAEQLQDFDDPSPGAYNDYDASVIVTETQLLIPMDHSWAYNQMDQPLAANWVLPEYDDASWAQGAALLYVESSGLPAAKQTPLVLGADTYYFRTQFRADTSADVSVLALQTVIDDGAIIYLNGNEILRLNMPGGAVNHFTRSNGSVSNAILEGPFEISPDTLVPGINTLAVEVHQSSGGSSDVVFGLQLDALTRTRQE
jgi:hypothetical protein